MSETTDNDETLQAIRRLVFSKVEYAVRETEDAWRHEVRDLLPLYLQFKQLDAMDAIVARLDSIESSINDFWNSRYNT